MSVEFRPAVRRDVPLLIGLSGGTGSGKTESALRIATGLAGSYRDANGKRFAVIDTENGRALHKADDYEFAHADLGEPYTPERYTEAIRAADEAGYPVIVVDSLSHEWDGVGGVLGLQVEEFRRLGEREAVRMKSWIEPKRRHGRFVATLLQVRAHVVVCMRAAEKVEMVKEGGETVVRPKQSLTGLDGWVPICDPRFPFELTASFLLMADRPGVPRPIKLEERHRAFVPLDSPLDEKVGEAFAAWARGETSDRDRLVGRLRELARLTGKVGEVERALAKPRDEKWLGQAIERAEAELAKQTGWQTGDDEPQQESMFMAPASVRRPNPETGE